LLLLLLLLLMLLSRLLCRRYITMATLAGDATKICFVGSSSQAYSNFFGNGSSYAHVNGWATYYNTTAPTWHSWDNTYACSSVQPAICEIPVAAYACATSPPPAPPPPPPTPPCQWHPLSFLACMHKPFLAAVPAPATRCMRYSPATAAMPKS
jgi:hypothetical protein